MAEVVVIGGGWAGCAAALSAARAGARVTLVERTDSLLGTGLVGGIMRNNGRYTATEEAIAMGAGELFHLTDQAARHRDLAFPGHRHATLYDISRVEPMVRRALRAMGINIFLECRATETVHRHGVLEGIVLEEGKDRKRFRLMADAFVEATGTAGPQSNCARYGNGCVMCILRCPTFGGRVSIASRAGVKELLAYAATGSPGSMSGSCKLHKDSLAPAIREALDKRGLAIVPVPREMQQRDSLVLKACQQYALRAYVENIILLDTGHAKLMTSYFPLEKLRQIPGLENARFEDPYAGGRGNSMRYWAISPHDDSLRVKGLENLFCAGEKAGPLVGHTEAIVTGTLAGHNAVRVAAGREPLVIPTTLAIGDAIAYVGSRVLYPEGLRQRFTFSGSVYFERMKQLGLYTLDRQEIAARVRQAELERVFTRPIL